jgi:hypothetical protein
MLIVPRRRVSAYDADAQAYISAVEAADGQALEAAVKDVINAFVVGCKADGIWAALKACCILAGARTLSGCLVPVVGPAPTNFGFTEPRYNRKTGLLGDGSSMYLNSNRNIVADPQDDCHTSVYVSTARSNSCVYLGCDPGARNSIYALDGNNIGFSLRQFAVSYSSAPLSTVGFMGQSRSSSSTLSSRVANASVSFNVNSTATGSGNFLIFARLSSGVIASHANARLSFYSIGESLDLAVLNIRVTALINAIAAAIP